MVAVPDLGRPVAVKELLNQRVSPAGIAVPLKLAAIVDTVEGTQRASSCSSRSGRFERGLLPRREGVRLRKRGERRERKLMCELSPGTGGGVRQCNGRIVTVTRSCHSRQGRGECGL